MVYKRLSAALFRLNGGYCSWIFLFPALCDVRRFQLTTRATPLAI